MTDQKADRQLEDIKRRHRERYIDDLAREGSVQAGVDRQWLIAEIERLRAENAELRNPAQTFSRSNR